MFFKDDRFENQLYQNMEVDCYLTPVAVSV